MKKLILASLISILMLNGCLDSNSGEPQQFSNALITIEFLHTENEEPITDEAFFVQLRETGTTSPVDIGEYISNENGIIEVELSSTVETSINQIIIQYTVENEPEPQFIEEDIELELRYNQPFDELDLQFLIEGKLPEEDENGEEA
jgi:hypothetical protein